MEPIGKNRITITKKMFYEGILRISQDNYRSATLKSMLLFLGLWLALLAYTLISGGSLSQTMSYLILIGLIGLWLGVYLPRYSAGRVWKVHEAKYGSAAERATLFYPDKLVITGDALEKEISYFDIQRVQISRHLLILITRDNSGILLARDGFDGTSENEISALLHSAVQ